MKSLLACLATAIALIVGLPSVAQAAVYAQIEGTGSTWSELIVQQWIADVNSNGMKVVYTGGGSTKGRKDFANNSVDFAISEIPYQGTDEQGAADTSNGREYAYLPIVAGGTAFTYQLKIGGKQVRNLRLSGETLAKIFTNRITDWSDPAIAQDNNGRTFPSLPITPVVRSDGSGTTAQLTTWLDAQYPSVWRPYFGKAGLTSYYPKKSGSRMIAQSGSDQVMNYIKGFSGNGTIGYVEYSYPVNANYPVVKVLNKAGYYVEPTQYNTAVALTKAKIRTDVPVTDKNYLTQDLGGVYTNTDPRAYPISSYSYMILPVGKSDPRMSTTKRQTLADFLYYSLCSGQSKAGPYGYSPLPLNLVKAGFDQISRLKTADPAVNLTDRDVKSCNNPTFDGKNLSKNLLAAKAPQPAACDKSGAGPCDVGTGTNTPSGAGGAGTTPGSGSGTTPGGGTSTPTAPVAGAGTGTTPGTSAPGSSVVDPASGQSVDLAADLAGTGAVGDVAASPVLLSAARSGDNAFGWVAAIELLALVLLPGLLTVHLRKRKVVR